MNALTAGQTSIVDGTSFASPITAALATQCFAMFESLTADEVKGFLLRHADKKPQWDGVVLSGGRARWPCAYDLGDAPPSYSTFSREGSAPELMRCTNGDTGPIHLDYGNEWYGPDVTSEHNATTTGSLSQEPLDANLGNRLGGFPCAIPRPVDNDINDDNGHVFSLGPPWVAGQVVGITFQVCSEHIRDTGGDPAPDAQVLDSAGGRYSAADPDKRVYATFWADWDGNGTFTGDYVALTKAGTPVDTIVELELPATAAPSTEPTTGCVSVERSFTVPPQCGFFGCTPPWYRFRLDYGEHKGDNDPLPLFEKDEKLPTDEEQRIAIFGEVEDYGFKGGKPVKIEIPPYRPPSIPVEITIYETEDCSGPALDTQLTDSNGTIDFFPLTSGVYSVEETVPEGWEQVTPQCQVLDLTGPTLTGSGMTYPPFQTYPAGPETLEVVLVTHMDLEINGERDNVTLIGPADIFIQPVGDTDFDSRNEVQIIVQAMSLTGVHDTLGSLEFRNNQGLPWQGQIEEVNPGQEFPANTFFEVRWELEVLDSGLIVEPQVPYILTPETPIPEWPLYQFPHMPPPESPPVAVVDQAVPSGGSVGEVTATSGLMPIPSEMTPVIILNINVDPDLDGFNTDLELACGSDPLLDLSTPEFTDGSYAGTDDDGDTLVDEVLPGGSESFDCDLDGWIGSTEQYIWGGVGTETDQSPCLQWPADLSVSYDINIADVLALKPPFGMTVPPASPRYDLAGGGSINIADVLALKPVFGGSCVP